MKAFNSIEDRVEYLVETAKGSMGINKDDKYYLDNGDFLLVLREIIENCNGNYRLNIEQVNKSYAHTINCEEVTFITATQRKIKGYI